MRVKLSSSIGWACPFTLALVGWVAAAEADDEPTNRSKPNIVLIITDQEREVMHWPEGWAEANLPARSRLMEHGMHFANAYCNSATCSPSRAALSQAGSLSSKARSQISREYRPSSTRFPAQR